MQWDRLRNRAAVYRVHSFSASNSGARSRPGPTPGAYVRSPTLGVQEPTTWALTAPPWSLLTGSWNWEWTQVFRCGMQACKLASWSPSQISVPCWIFLGSLHVRSCFCTCFFTKVFQKACGKMKLRDYFDIKKCSTSQNTFSLLYIFHEIFEDSSPFV